MGNRIHNDQHECDQCISRLEIKMKVILGNRGLNDLLNI